MATALWIRATTAGVVGLLEGFELDIADLLGWLNVDEASATEEVFHRRVQQFIQKFALSLLRQWQTSGRDF
jgi:hypothetical protein